MSKPGINIPVLCVKPQFLTLVNCAWCAKKSALNARQEIGKKTRICAKSANFQSNKSRWRRNKNMWSLRASDVSTTNAKTKRMHTPNFATNTPRSG